MSRADGITGIARDVLADAKAAIDASHAGSAEDQLELLAAPTRFGGEKAEKQREKVASELRARGAGRPPGATNLATRDMLAFLRAHGFDPVERQFRWAMHTPETLAAELDCDKLEAFDRLVALWGGLAKLFYAPLAPVDGQGNAVVPFLQVNFGGAQAPGGVVLPPWLTDPEVRKTLELEAQAAAEKSQQNQAVSEAAESVSHGGVSHDGT